MEKQAFGVARVGRQTHERQMEGLGDSRRQDHFREAVAVGALRPHLRQLRQPGFQPSLDADQKAEASKDGTLGYTYGDYEARRAGQT